MIIHRSFTLYLYYSTSRVILFGIEAGGARSWYNLGFINFQPSEFVKVTTSLFWQSILVLFKQISLDIRIYFLFL